MSAPPDRPRRHQPLRERTQSQNNTLAIRVVPYSPPRLGGQGESSAGQPPSPPPPLPPQHPHRQRQRQHQHQQQHQQQHQHQHQHQQRHRHADEAGASASGNDGDAGPANRGKDGYASSPGSALSSPSSSALSLARPREGRVSGSKLATGPGSSSTTTPGPTSPSSHVANTSAVNAPGSAHGHRYQQDEQQQHEDSSAPASPTSTSSAGRRPPSRRRNFISVHADKTFSLLPRASQPPAHLPAHLPAGLTSPPPSFSTGRTSSSHEGLSSDAFSDRLSSPFTASVTSASIPDPSLTSLSPFTPSPGSSTTQLAEDPIASSPWNYRMVGGLRKVPKTPDLKKPKSGYSSASALDTTPTPLPPLPEISAFEATPSRSVVPKTSFASDQTASTGSDTTNYKVYARSSPVDQEDDSDSLPPAELSFYSQSNVQILGESSPPAPSSPVRPRTAHSDQNYIVHGDPSPSSSLATVSRKPRPTYSQESLIVPPLKPGKHKSRERLGYYKSRSRESLRRAASIKSITSIISHDGLAPFLVAPAFLNLHRPTFPSASFQPQQQQQQQQDSWASTSAAEASGSGTASSPALLQPPRVPMVDTHPHQWSSQLSTVLSESEDGSSRGGSRSLSAGSRVPSGSFNRASSAGWASSTHSRQMLSISSSLAQQLEESRSHSRSDSLDRPHPAFLRGQGQRAQLVHDQDEHGDGLAELYRIHQQPSRSGLSGFFASSNSSGRNLHSSGSSRSITSGSIPFWARVYYGSGERGAPSFTDGSDDSLPTSSFPHSGSPSADHFPLNINTPRRRAKEVRPRGLRPFSDSASVEIGEAPAMPDYRLRSGLRKMTSSIWSPHLWVDKRATRYSIWEPPSVNWSAESGVMGRRNVQVILFMVGFIFPFAWMIGALLPLPPYTQLEDLEKRHGAFGIPESFRRQIKEADDARYQSAKWWRTLNRFMSIIGLLIIGAIIALVVVGTRQGWETYTVRPRRVEVFDCLG